MSSRTVIVLAIALLALLALVTFGERGGGSSSGQGEPFVPTLETALGSIERVTIVKANNETVATLERRPDSWVAADKHGYTADASKLRQALTALADARILEQKTANPELYARLGVEDVEAAEAAGLRVAFTAEGQELPTVILGNAEGGRYRYVRRVGDAQSYLIDKNPDFPRAAAQWLDSRIIDVRSERVREVTITHADGEVVRISKTDPSLTNFEVANIPEGRELSYPGVANVIGNALRELNLEDVEPAPATPGENPTVVEYRTFDGLVVRIVGVKTEDASWITLEASADPAPAAGGEAPAAPAAGDAANEPPAPAEASEPAVEAAAAPPADPAAEAERINAKVRGWRYKIAGFQYDQMTRRIADLLKAPNV
jgi:hypothetical protein